ncbi:MAG: RraA family protein [Betaproteobacteria bacterium]|nr:RraA family protein [Betaproteobacteria bacterium]
MSNARPDIIKTIARVSPEQVKAAKKFQAAILADVNGRRGTAHSRIRPLAPSMKLAGPAITVEVRPGDNLMIHVAIALAQPGDVIVVDAKGDQTCALIGEIMVTLAEKIGIAGFVLDGPVRDAEALIAKGYPIFSFGTNPCGPTKKTPGRVNWPTNIAGVAVTPGDLVVADADGVTFVEREKVDGIIALAEKKEADERVRIDGIRAGKQLSPAWLPKALADAEVTMEA